MKRTVTFVTCDVCSENTGPSDTVRKARWHYSLVRETVDDSDSPTRFRYDLDLCSECASDSMPNFATFVEHGRRNP